MAAKMKTMSLSQVPNPEWWSGAADTVPQHRYVVEEVKNSTAPAIRDILTKTQADDYCGRGDWNVTIRHGKR